MSPADDPWELARRAAYERLIASPFEYESYHALFELYEEAGWIDAAYCMASTLVFLKHATPAQEACVQEHRAAEPRRATQPLSEDMLRRHVFHPDQDLYLTGILGLIGPAIAAWRATQRPPSLEAKDQVDVSTDGSLLSSMIRYVRHTLGVVQPEVFVRPQDIGDLVLMNSKCEGQLRPTIVVFRSLLNGKTEPQLAFALGRYMLDLYLPHFCFVALERSPQAVKQVLLACFHGVGLPVQADLAALTQIGKEIFGRMQLGARERLRDLIQRFLEVGGSTDVKRWVAASELTAYRVGLLLAGDLRIAGQMIAQEQAPLGVGATMSPRDKIKELVLYSISDDYFIARQAIGVHVAERRAPKVKAAIELPARSLPGPPDASLDPVVREHEANIAKSPFGAEGYHALFERHHAAGRVDAAYCVASTLAFLGKTTAVQAAYLAEHRPRGHLQAPQRLDEDTLRRHVLHPDQDRCLTDILGLVAPAVATWRAAKLPGSLDASKRIDVATDPAVFSRVTKYVSEVLGVAPPDVFVGVVGFDDLTVMNLERDGRPHAALVVFQSLWTSDREAELRFAVGRALTDLYPAHSCCMALERKPQALERLVMACLHGMGLPAQGDVHALEPIAREVLGRLPPAVHDPLRGRLEQLVAAGGSIDVKRWMGAAELTAHRVGLLLAGDLKIAERRVSREQAPLGLGPTMLPRDRLAALLRYGVSDDYCVARRAIGVSAS